MNKILMPETLTAENGAKAALMGEFSESVMIDCPECYGDGLDQCEMCRGAGQLEQKVTVSWTTIKEIYKRAVAVVGEVRQ